MVMFHIVTKLGFIIVSVGYTMKYKKATDI